MWLLLGVFRITKSIYIRVRFFKNGCRSGRTVMVWFAWSVAIRLEIRDMACDPPQGIGESQVAPRITGHPAPCLWIQPSHGISGWPQMLPSRHLGIKVQVTYQKRPSGFMYSKRTSRRYQVPLLMFRFQHFAGRWPLPFNDLEVPWIRVVGKRSASCSSHGSEWSHDFLSDDYWWEVICDSSQTSFQEISSLTSFEWPSRMVHPPKHGRSFQGVFSWSKMK